MNKQSHTQVFGATITWPILQATCSYYFRLVAWIVVLSAVLFVMNQVSNDTARALRAIFCYSFLLGLLVILKIYAPGQYAWMQWFCQPGNLFLRSWISLMFYVYLVPVPRDLAPVPAPQIVAWIFQCVFGNLLAVIIASSVMGSSLSLVRWWNRASVDTDDVQLLEYGEDGDGVLPASAGSFSANGATDQVQSDIGFDVEKENGGVELKASFSAASSVIDIARGSTGSTPGQQSQAQQQGSDRESNNRKSTISFARASDMFLAIDSLQSGFKGEFSAALLAAAAAGSAVRHSTLSGRDVSLSYGNSSRISRVSIARMSTIKAEVRGKGSAAASSVAESITMHLQGQGNQHGNAAAENNTSDHHVDRESFHNMAVFNPALSAKTIPGSMRVISEASEEAAGSRVASAESIPSVSPSTSQRAPMLVALPIIPTMPQLANFWSFIAIATSIVTFFSPNKTQNAVISFQLSATVAIFLVCTTYRSRLIQPFHPFMQVALQSVVMFTPAVIFVVVFTSLPTYTSWEDCLQQYLTGSDAVADFGAGDYVSFLLDAAVVSLAFVSVDAFVTYFNLLPILVPAIWASCALIVIQASLLSLIMRSPDEISRPLLTRTVTTPVAINIGELTGGSASIIASSSVIDGVLSYRTVTYLMDVLGITNPMTRGATATISGSLLGALAVDENGEKAAAGIAMAAYGMCTILYAVSFAITPFLDFVLNP